MANGIGQSIFGIPIGNIFPFNLLGGTTTTTQQQQAGEGQIAFPPWNMFPFLEPLTSAQQQQQQDGGLPFLFPLFGNPNQQQANAQVPTLPVTVPSQQYISGQVPMGIPLVPPVSDMTDAFVDTIDTMLRAPITAMQSQSQQQSQVSQQLMNSVTNGMGSIATMTKTILLAPEKSREKWTGQPAIPSGANQQQQQQQQQQQSTQGTNWFFN